MYWGDVGSQAGDLSRSEELASGPGLDPYYARQREKVQADLNDQLAARGAYGTSVGVGAIGEALTDLGAQQANREAEYARLVAGQADRERMNRLMGFGGLAEAAQGAELSRLGGGISAALGVDQAGLARLASAMDAATTAQDLRRTRGRDYMGDVVGATMPAMGTVGQGFEDILAADQATQDSAIAAALGLPAEALAQDYRNQQMHREDLNMVLDWIKTFTGGGGMGGMGGGG
jgi:hypothetical protein